MNAWDLTKLKLSVYSSSISNYLSNFAYYVILGPPRRTLQDRFRLCMVIEEIALKDKEERKQE